MPDKFIPVAEEIGVILPLGEWVLRTACRDAASWPDHTKLRSICRRCSSARSPGRDGTPALADSGCRRTGSSWIVTESVLPANTTPQPRHLYELAALGVASCLTDFGTGYSSLSYLRAFSVQQDQDSTFVRRRADPPGGLWRHRLAAVTSSGQGASTSRRPPPKASRRPTSSNSAPSRLRAGARLPGSAARFPSVKSAFRRRSRGHPHGGVKRRLFPQRMAVTLTLPAYRIQ